MPNVSALVSVFRPNERMVSAKERARILQIAHERRKLTQGMLLFSRRLWVIGYPKEMLQDELLATLVTRHR